MTASIAERSAEPALEVLTVGLQDEVFALDALGEAVGDLDQPVVHGRHAVVSDRAAPSPHYDDEAEGGCQLGLDRNPHDVLASSAAPGGSPQRCARLPQEKIRPRSGTMMKSSLRLPMQRMKSGRQCMPMRGVLSIAVWAIWVTS